MLIVADSARISPLADIEDSVRGTRIVIGDGVVIDSFVKIKAVGGEGDVHIGRNTHINSGCVIYTGNGITVGAGVLIAANCTLAPVNHEFRERAKTIMAQRFQPSRGGITIEDDVWIGAGCVILDGATIGKGCVVGANSVVRGNLDGYSLYVGSPARCVGHRK